MNSLTVTANHILVAIPERYHAPKGPRNPTNGLGLTLISGEDAMAELEAQIKTGGVLQIETETDTSINNLVRTGQVLAIPPQLTTEMVLCAAGEKVRTYADITPVVEMGHAVFLDWSALTDEAEILPGIYRVPYAAVICVIEIDEMVEWPWLTPVGGYVLLSRVWADDVHDYEVDGAMQKVRFTPNGKLIAQYNVPPLPNEGVVAWVDAPLKGALNELHPGQRAIISPGHALIETIAGTEYLCVRHDYCLAVKEPQFPDILDSLLLETELHREYGTPENLRKFTNLAAGQTIGVLASRHPAYNA